MCNRAAYHSHCGKHHQHHSWHEAGRHWKNQFAAQWGYPPVHVEEQDDKYVISLYAAGYAKTDFQVALKDDILSISVDKPENEAAPSFERRRSEFRPGNFKREFRLNDKIDKEGISAKYEEGILAVTLPKLEGFETMRKDIGIA